MEDKKQDGFSQLFVLVFCGLIALYASVGLTTGLFGSVWHDLLRFVTGDAAHITRRDHDLGHMIAVAMTLCAVVFPFVVVIGHAAQRLTPHWRQGDGKEVVLVPLPQEPPTGKRIRAVAIALHKVAALVFYEEFYSRWIFLGFIAGSNPPANSFYGLFLIGNTLWALMHLWNYPTGERHPIRVLPHFLLGIPMAIMFRTYGLGGAFLVHFVWDLIPLLPGLVDQAYQGKSLTLRSTG